jgi:hypothetical protein
MRAHASRALHTIARYLVWQLPEEGYPSNHPLESRRTPADYRA